LSIENTSEHRISHVVGWFAGVAFQGLLKCFDQVPPVLRSQRLGFLQFGKVGTALTEILYQDVNDTGENVEFTYYPYLLFHYEEGAWTLFYDQNTMIEKANNE